MKSSLPMAVLLVGIVMTSPTEDKRFQSRFEVSGDLSPVSSFSGLELTSHVIQHLTISIASFIHFTLDREIYLLDEEFQSTTHNIEKIHDHEIKFLLYTKNTADRPFIIPHDFTSLDYTDFDSDRGKTLFFMHGYKCGRNWFEEAIREILKKRDFNMINIDWEFLATIPYIKAAPNALKVGKYAGEFISRLADKTGLDISRVYGIGHSLGAQGMGALGRSVFSCTQSKIGRITGLDPAGPNFSGQFDWEKSLTKKDADFVDVWHTNGCPPYRCEGTERELGHVDFYPAGGEHQPGCESIKGCSHNRSVTYFVESVRYDIPFTATRCSGWEEFTEGGCRGDETTNMGFETDTRALEGRYYLQVNPTSPYAQGK